MEREKIYFLKGVNICRNDDQLKQISLYTLRNLTKSAAENAAAFKLPRLRKAYQ